MGNRSKRRSTNQVQKAQPSSQPDPPQRQVVLQQWEGPLPSPDILERFNEIIPGAAERIIAQFEQQASHRQGLEKQTLQAQVQDAKDERSERRLGQVFGFLIGMTAVVGGCVVAVFNAEWAGGGISITGIAALVGVFVYGRRSEEPEKR